MGKYKQFIRAFVDSFPPLRVAMKLYDCYVYVIETVAYYLYSFLRTMFRQLVSLLSYLVESISRVNTRNRYQSLKEVKKIHKEPLPYKYDRLKRSITYHGALVLATFLYIFVYYVLIKSHSYSTISVALLLMLAYLIILDNSHDIRSIVMLSVPFMFSNRGRALVFCLMLSIMLKGPLQNTQLNVNEIHLSLNCCKQYLLAKTDKSVEENIIKHVARLEDVTVRLISDIKGFARELKERFEQLIRLALTIQQYMESTLKRLVDIVNICNNHKLDAYNNCQKTFEHAYEDCKSRLGSTFDILCSVVKPLRGLCEIVKVSGLLCEIPHQIVVFLDETVGERLRYHMRIIENEFYVDVDIDHVYYYNGTKSKPYKQVMREIKFDIRQKFWYIHLFSNVFKLVSLVLVCWILLSATLYHMHYLRELSYDNVYIDSFLSEIEERRRRKLSVEEGVPERSHDKTPLLSREKSASEEALSWSEGEEEVSERERLNRKLLFPISEEQASEYTTPFGLWMIKAEKQKLYIAGLIWLAINGYVFFFVFLDFSLFKLMDLVRNILDEVLFKSELPIVEVSSWNNSLSGQLVHYNRTYISYLRARQRNETAKFIASNAYNNSIGSRYRRLMNSIRENLPDDVQILDSLQLCLPKPREPNYGQYLKLSLLACFTLLAVVVEAYAMRSRHCIANLFYPRMARRRAVWLYRKLLREKLKFGLSGGGGGKEVKQEEPEGGVHKMIAPAMRQLLKRRR